MHRSVRTFWISCLAAILCSSAVPFTAQAESKPPNIVFIFTDDHAPQSIGAYGSVINQTPNIDRLADEGAIFLRNMCANSICGPSRASVLTGKHSHSNGFVSNKQTFDGAQMTFPKLLRQAGYSTAMIGKWHLRSDPTGFDHWEILPGQGHYYNPDFYTAKGKSKRMGYVTDIITDLSMDWMTEQRDSGKPFLLMCQQKAPHRIWAPGPDHLTLFDGETIPEPPTLFDDFSNRVPALADNEMMIAKHMMYDYDLKVPGLGIPDELGRDFINREYARMTPAQQATWDAAYTPKNEAFLKANLKGKALVRWKYQRYIKDYLRCVQSVDDNVGRMLDYLEKSGLAENTIVVYSSDQGFYLGEHGMYDKRWMYEESLSMPLLMRWPAGIKAGTRIEKLTQNIDFAPTFLTMAGITPPSDIQGDSLLPLLTNEADADWRDAIYYHYYEEGEHNVPRHEGVRTERFKLIHYYGSSDWELFDLLHDPREMKSVYDTPAYTEVLAVMQEQLKALRVQYAVPPLAAASPSSK